MKRYFRKSENYTPNPDYNVDLSVRLLSRRLMAYIDRLSQERGKGGRWNTSYPPTNPVSQAFLEAGVRTAVGLT